MKKFFVVLVALLVVGLAGSSFAQDMGYNSIGPGGVNNLNEPGSVLVFPLVDNINYTTIINIANTGNYSVVLECYAVTVGPDGGVDMKIDWIINESPKEKFWWNTAIGRTHTNVDGDLTRIPALGDRKGYVFCFVVGGKPFYQDGNDNNTSGGGGYDPYDGRYEKRYNHMKGDATLFDGVRAFNYNAIPSQAVEPMVCDPRQPVDEFEKCKMMGFRADRTLKFNGWEYTAATSQIMIEGFAQGAFGLIDGGVAVVNIGIDFIKSEQPEFDINVWCWNEDEVPFSIHLHYTDWEHYSLTDWNATRFNLGTDAFHCATTATEAIWGVMYQTAGSMAFGGNAWQHPKTGKSTYVKLPAFPIN